MYHFPNHIDVVFPYTHTHTVLVSLYLYDNQYANYCIITHTQSDTTDNRLISVHVLRTELQVSIESAAWGQPPPKFWRKVFQYNPPPDFGGFCSVILNSIIKF